METAGPAPRGGPVHAPPWCRRARGGLGHGASFLESPAQQLGRVVARRAADRPGVGGRLRPRHRRVRTGRTRDFRNRLRHRSFAADARQARRRNSADVRSGRVDLRLASVTSLPDFGAPMDKIMAVNSLGFWEDPVARLRELRNRLRPGGVIALASQPRCPGATAATSVRAGDEIEAALARAGFRHAHVEMLELEPPVVCVLADAP